jgi:ubiquinol-cytochrome c reductase cytochrome c subunit
VRGLIKARVIVPLALVGGVLLVGLLAFSPGASSPASASPTTTTTPLTVPNSGTSGSTPSVSSYSPRTVEGALKAASPSNQGGLTYLTLPKSFVAPGEALFAANCSSCHGPEALGTDRAPNLQGLGAGTVDFWVSTGRMPLEDSSVQATRKPPRFNRLQTLEIASFVQSFTPGVGVGVPVVNTAGADLENGNEMFSLNCAACHTITGAGDALMEGAYAPSLHLATPTQIIEAIRSGPGNMPRFGPGDITNAEARDIATYVDKTLQHPSNPGGFGLGGVGPVGEGFVGLLLGVGVLMLVCFWIGDRT